MYCKNGIDFGAIEDRMSIAVVEAQILREDATAALSRALSMRERSELRFEENGLYLEWRNACLTSR